MILSKLLEAKYEKDISLSNKSLLSLPNNLPSKVEGHFYCSHNHLTSLQHCPTSIGGDFYCQNNQLTSLQYCPTSIGGDFYCSRNQLTSLQHCPTSIGGDFYCSRNQLTSLKYLPKEIGEDIYLSNNPDCYEELWRLCQTKLGGDLIIKDNEKLADLFNDKYKNANHREMLRFQMDILDLI